MLWVTPAILLRQMFLILWSPAAEVIAVPCGLVDNWRICMSAL